MQRLSSKVIDRSNGTKTEEVVYKCRNCGHILRRKERSRDENYKGPRGGGPFIGGMGGGFLVATVEVAADLAEEVSEVEALEAEEPEAVFKNKNIHNLIVYTYEKSTIIVIVVIVLIAIWGITSYNGMVKMDESVSTAWSNVENQYQRRSDLIPNLVNTVKGYASHEKETFQAVVDARSKATQMQISADDLTPEKMQAYQKAQGEVGSALSRLLAITEAYPDLKANENFKELQAQLEGTENRISVERKRFNDTARAYNTAIRTFPRNLLAGMFGFDKRPYFESEEGADKAPKVEF